jgi:hypothetical protein
MEFIKIVKSINDGHSPSKDDIFSNPFTLILVCFYDETYDKKLSLNHRNLVARLKENGYIEYFMKREHYSRKYNNIKLSNELKILTCYGFLERCERERYCLSDKSIGIVKKIYEILQEETGIPYV